MNPAFDSVDDDRAGSASFEGGLEADSLGFESRDDAFASDSGFEEEGDLVASGSAADWSSDSLSSDDATDATGGSKASDKVKQVSAKAGDRASDVAGTAQDEAAAVKDTAVEAGSNLTDSVTEQAGEVAAEVGHQSRRLMDEGVSELRTQAGAGQQRLAELSRSLGGELQAMHANSDQSGPLTDLVGSAQHMFDDAANWLERNEPADVLDSVRRYASRNPWTFLAISAGVGFLGARVVRGMKKPEGDTQQRAALDVPSGYHGGYTAPLSPVEDPSYAGGPRYDADSRVQPSATPGTSFPPAGTAGWDSSASIPPVGEPGSDPRGL